MIWNILMMLREMHCVSFFFGCSYFTYIFQLMLCMQSQFFDNHYFIQIVEQIFSCFFQSKSQGLVRICWLVLMNCGDCYLAFVVMQLILTNILLVSLMSLLLFSKRILLCIKMFPRHYRSHFHDLVETHVLLWLYFFIKNIDFPSKMFMNFVEILVNQNKAALSPKKSMENCHAEYDFLSEFGMQPTYSKKAATKNIKSLVSCSNQLLYVLSDLFISPLPEKHFCLKVLHLSLMLLILPYRMIPLSYVLFYCRKCMNYCFQLKRLNSILLGPFKIILDNF